ncbi:cupin domain-containing protein, partial [Aeromonas caviae]|uniref:cupin domain-containing protein n=1 Tax=Aeromonas caviae TaxID=648 RepID=UPI001CC5FAE7
PVCKSVETFPPGHYLWSKDGELKTWYKRDWMEYGCWAVHYTEHEYCQMLEGEAVIHDEQGGRLHLKPGDQFVIPAGFVGQWETLTPCRKLYVIFEPAAT